jgi:hypothetical protein
LFDVDNNDHEEAHADDGDAWYKQSDTNATYGGGSGSEAQTPFD